MDGGKGDRRQEKFSFCIVEHQEEAKLEKSSETDHLLASDGGMGG